MEGQDVTELGGLITKRKMTGCDGKHTTLHTKYGCSKVP
jgi:hypothetical protein